MKRKIQSIPLNLVKLDQENVRFGGDIAQNQREAIELMMADPEDAKKILKLAEHIASHGLDPTELQLATPDEDGSFIVLEGNRRLTALKLLQKPDLCPDERLVKGFRLAQGKLSPNSLNEVECSVVPSRADGDMWVELKHTGQNGGVGRVNWDSDIRDERRARHSGIESIGRQIRNLIKDNPTIFSQEAIRDIFDIPVTTLTRLFSSKPAQEIFRFKVESKELIPLLGLEHIAPALEFAIDLFVHHGFNVNDVRSDEDRRRFVERIPNEIDPAKLAEQTEHHYDTKNQTDSSGDIESTDAPHENKDRNSDRSGWTSTDSETNTPVSEKKTRAKSSSRARKYLLPWPLNIPNARINEIYRELRSNLEVDTCPNATAVLFRVFIEVSCDDFSQKQNQLGTPVTRDDNQKPITDDDKLSAKIKAVTKHLADQGKIDKQHSKAISKRSNTHDAIGSVDHFNQFVHGSASAPLPSELKDIAEEYKPMLLAIWQ